MSGNDWIRRLPAELPDVLEDLAAPRKPEYADALFERLAVTPQRPRWSFAVRWLPAPIARVRVPRAPVPLWQLIVVGLILLALIAAAIAAVGSRPRLPPPFGLAGPGAIGYVADGQIWLAGPDGGGGHPISAGGIDLHPVFSPDGTKLAFVRLAERGSHPNWEEWGSVVVADFDGANEIVIDEDQEGISPISWSADGRLLVYSKIVGGADQIVVARTDGFGVQQITNAGEASWGPILAPNGRQIAFVRSMPAGFQLRLINLDGTGDTALGDEPLTRFDLAAWSPDSRTIVLGSGEPAMLAADLWRVDVATGDTAPFVVESGNQLGPTWSPDGRAVAYVDEARLGKSTIRVVGADGSSPRAISDLGSWTYPSWSPDGRHVIAGDQAPGGIPKLVILDAAAAAPPVQVDLPDRANIGRVDLPVWQRVAP